MRDETNNSNAQRLFQVSVCLLGKLCELRERFGFPRRHTLTCGPNKGTKLKKICLKHKDIAQHRFLEVGDNLYLLFGVFSTGNNFHQRCGFARESSGFPRRHTLTCGPNKGTKLKKNSLKHKDITQHRFLEVGDNLYLLFGVFSTGNNFRRRCGFARESSGFPRRHTLTCRPNKGTKLKKKQTETQGYYSTSFPRGRRQSLLAVWCFLYWK